MGHSLTPVSFWNIDIPIKEVISASSRNGNYALLRMRNLKSLAQFKGTLSQYDNDPKHLVFEFWNHKRNCSEFVEFIAK